MRELTFNEEYNLNEVDQIRELTLNEVDEVSGGFLPAAAAPYVAPVAWAAGGAAVGLVTSYFINW